MKVLFLDYANEVHSQIAEGFYNFYVQGSHGRSAGLKDDIKGSNSLDSSILRLMEERDINLENARTKQFRARHSTEVSLIIYLETTAPKTETEKERLANAHLTQFITWPLTPNLSLQETRDEIKEYVEHLADIPLVDDYLSEEPNL